MRLEKKSEIVREVWSQLSRRRFAAAAELLDPDVRFDFTRSRGPQAGMFIGRDAVKRNFEEIVGMWEEWVLEPEDFVDLDRDRILFSIQGRMTGRDEIELTIRAAHIWTIRDGVIVEAIFFQTREDALRAADLPA